MNAQPYKTQSMKKIEMLFYQTLPSEKNLGFKYVLYKITDDEGGNAYDWGFSYWNGIAWDPIEVPEGYTASVEYWANTIDPQLLLKEPSKIIKLS